MAAEVQKRPAECETALFQQEEDLPGGGVPEFLGSRPSGYDPYFEDDEPPGL